MRKPGPAPVAALLAAVLVGSVLVGSGLAGPATAQGLAKSLRPLSRPVVDMAANSQTTTQTLVSAAARSAGGAASLRPRPRPAVQTAPAALPPVPDAPLPSVALALPATPAPESVAPPAQVAAPMTPLVRPLARPEGLITPASQAQPKPEKSGGLFGGKKKKQAAAPTAGSICGDPVIKGERLSRITNKVQGCGIEDPVRVTSIDGIRLSQPATLDCAAATALRRWIDTGLRPAYGRSTVVELKIAAHYICRPRNNKKGAKVSEHGRGRAIDIAGIVTSEGRTQMVYKGFDATMRKAYKAACGTFGTTLGPGSDGYHEDHMHFDVPARARSPYCR